jgi:K+/H+ antiporter YhaU regulatory subunit KhtT
VLQHVAFLAGSDTADGIRIEEVKLGPSSVVVGRTLGETAFRQRYGISVIGIVRREKRMNAPGPDERLCAGDGLIILGDAGSIEAFRSQAEGGEDPEPGQGALGQTPMPSG